MSPQPPLPKLPPLPPSPIDPLRGMIQQGRRQVEKARSDLRSIAGEVTSTSGEEHPREIKDESRLSIREGAETGTACITCSDEHFSEVSGALNEAMRFARNKGIENDEVIKRIRHAREELNAMERFDLSPQQIINLPEIEKPVARWAVATSRELRHSLNTVKNSDDLEKVAAQASDAADELEKKTMHLKKHYEGEIHPSIPDLRQWLEERKKQRLGK